MSSVNEAPRWVFLQQVLHYTQRGLMAHTAPYGLQGAVCSHDAAPYLFGERGLATVKKSDESCWRLRPPPWLRAALPTCRGALRHRKLWLDPGHFCSVPYSWF